MRRSGRGEASAANKIAATVEKVAGSGLPVAEYFRRHRVLFSRVQYFRYQARLASQGMAGLEDGRSRGNHRKLTPAAEGYLRGLHQADPKLSLEEIRQALKRKLRIEVGRSTLSGFFQRVGEAIVWPRPREPERVTSAGGGFEILAALALHLGWVEHGRR
jgi:transposase